MESFELEKTLKASWSNSPAANSDTYSYISVLRAPSCLTLSVRHPLRFDIHNQLLAAVPMGGDSHLGDVDASPERGTAPGPNDAFQTPPAPVDPFPASVVIRSKGLGGGAAKSSCQPHHTPAIKAWPL